MIHFKYRSELEQDARLSRTMFLDRAEQFYHRLGWDVTMDHNGEERDEYDALNPLYIVVENQDGEHEGSMRFLPTTGRTMINEHFLQVTGGKEIVSPFIWECTRFCVGRWANRRTAAKLLAAGGKLMREYKLNQFIGVFDERMERVYRLLGSEPIVIGRQTCNESNIGVGLWSFDLETYQRLLKRAGITAEEMELSFVNSRLTSRAVEEIA